MSKKIHTSQRTVGLRARLKQLNTELKVLAKPYHAKQTSVYKVHELLTNSIREDAAWDAKVKLAVKRKKEKEAYARLLKKSAKGGHFEATNDSDKLPARGVAVIGYKVVDVYEASGSAHYGRAILKLKIPAHAHRVMGTDDQNRAGNRKCRASEAEVLAVHYTNVPSIPNPRFKSRYNGGLTEYVVGQTVKPGNGYHKSQLTCAPGIHFFLTPELVQKYRKV